MKKKAFLGFSILIFVIAIVGVVYVLLLTPCENRYAISRPPIFSIGPYYLITDQGRLFPAQTYHYQNEGPWVGDHTLLIVIAGRAVFVTHYPLNNPIYKRVACRAIYP
jgi:hypothetical protein